MQPRELPEVYVNENGENFDQPVYILHADGYYGDSYWYEGDRFVWLECPNHNMQPLNRAAGEAIAEWQKSLPMKGESVQQADLDEARRFLPAEEMSKLNAEQYSETVFRTAVAIKHKRENKPGLILPSFQPVRTAAASATTPMPNANIQGIRDGVPAGFGEPSRGPQRASNKVTARSTKAMGNVPGEQAPVTA